MCFSHGFLPPYERPSRVVAGRPGLGAETCLFSGVWPPALALTHCCASSPCTTQAVTWKSPDVGEPCPGHLLAPSSHTPRPCPRHGLFSLWPCSPSYVRDAAASLGEASPGPPPSPLPAWDLCTCFMTGCRPLSKKSRDVRLSTWHPLCKACDGKGQACFCRYPTRARGW